VAVRTARWALLLLLASAPAAQAAVRPPGLITPLGNEQLSDERTITRWAYAQFRSKIRTAPTINARSFARLRFRTEDGLGEVYLVLRSYVDSKGRTWLQIRVPMRPNGRKGWVYEDQMDELRLVRTYLSVDRGRLRATLWDSGRKVWTSRIGVGAPGTATPAGRFYIRERIRNLRGNPLYGPWAFGTSAYSNISDWPGGGVVGIHGTNQPHLIPGRPSHGCIRVPNRKIVQLARLMPNGTPVKIY
jgi:hypothetical protein